ncbi:hypothetical protein PFISCL1PPCAC_20672, partial [Pristionchus fissidentatus]
GGTGGGKTQGTAEPSRENVEGVNPVDLPTLEAPTQDSYEDKRAHHSKETPKEEHQEEFTQERSAMDLDSKR